MYNRYMSVLQHVNRAHDGRMSKLPQILTCLLIRSSIGNLCSTPNTYMSVLGHENKDAAEHGIARDKGVL
jgi:hypothetical protein